MRRRACDRAPSMTSRMFGCGQLGLDAPISSGRARSSVIGLVSTRGFVVARWTGASRDYRPSVLISPVK
jgi:hypothetical protein